MTSVQLLSSTFLSHHNALAPATCTVYQIRQWCHLLVILSLYKLFLPVESLVMLKIYTSCYFFTFSSASHLVISNSFYVFYFSARNCRKQNKVRLIITNMPTTQLRLDQRFSKYGMHINNGHMAHSYIHGHRVFCCSFNEHRASGTALYSLGATT